MLQFHPPKANEVLIVHRSGCPHVRICVAARRSVCTHGARLGARVRTVSDQLSVNASVDRKALGTILLDLCKQQQHDAAWRLFRQAAARKLPLPLPVYHKLLQQAGQVAGVEEVTDILSEQLRRYGFASNHVYTSYIHALLKCARRHKAAAGAASAAFQVWADMQAGDLPLQQHPGQQQQQQQQQQQEEGVADTWASGVESTASSALDDTPPVTSTSSSSSSDPGFTPASSSSNSSSSSSSSRAGAAALATITASSRRGPHKPPDQLAYEAWLQLQGSGQLLDGHAYLAGIHACVAVGRLPEAETLLELLRLVAGPTHPLLVGGHNLLLAAHSRAGDQEAARKLFLAMKKRGVSPDLVTYNTLMGSFVAAGQRLRARAVLDKAKREGVTPDAYSYTILMRAAAQAGDVGGVLAALNDMTAAGVTPTLVTYGVLVDCYASCGYLTAAAQLLLQLEARGPPPNRHMYNTLLKGLLLQQQQQQYDIQAGREQREGQQQQEQAGAESPGSSRQDASTDTSMGRSRSSPLFNNSNRQVPSSSSSSSSGGPDAVGQLLSVSGLLAHMAGRGVAPGVDTYTLVLNHLVQVGDTRSVTALLQQMEASGLPLDAVALTSLLAAAAAAEDTRAVLALFDVMIQSAQPLVGSRAAPVAAAAAATGGGRMPAGSAAGGEGRAGTGGAVADAQQAGAPLAAISGQQAEVSSTTAQTSAAAAGAAAAAGVAGAIPPRRPLNARPPSSRPDPGAATSSSRSGTGRGIPAVCVAAGPDVMAWTGLVAALVKCGCMAEAEAALERALATADALQQPVPVKAFGLLINGYKWRRRQPEALATLRRLLQLGGTPSAADWEDVLQLCLQDGEVKAARQVLRAMKLTGALDKGAAEAQLLAKYEQQVAAVAAGGAPETTGSSSSSSNRGSRQGTEQNMGMERLKWWFGLPNSYYPQGSEQR